MTEIEEIKPVRNYENVFTFMGRDYGFHKGHLYRLQYTSRGRVYTARRLVRTHINNKLGYIIGQRFKSLEQIEKNWPINNLKK